MGERGDKARVRDRLGNAKERGRHQISVRTVELCDITRNELKPA